jgi:RNA polymerase sigma factor (TIGR02999 family)
MHVADADVTELLREWSEGDGGALDRLVPMVYEHLHRMAHQRLRGEVPNHSLNTTALVHEAYLKLVDLRRARFKDRAHFLAIASRIMRRVLVDNARSRRALKRGGGARPIELDENIRISDDTSELVGALDEALQRLEAVDPRQSQILEQRYFGGLSLEETAEAVGISLATVKRELRFARAWLAADMRSTADGR